MPTRKRTGRYTFLELIEEMTVAVGSDDENNRIVTIKINDHTYLLPDPTRVALVTALLATSNVFQQPGEVLPS